MAKRPAMLTGVVAMLLLAGRLSGLAGADPVPYVRKDTARASWEASLAAKPNVRAGPWYYIGPFDHTGGKGYQAVYPPEESIELAAGYRGKNNQLVGWREGKRFTDGRVNNLRIFKDNDRIVVYLYRAITSEKTQQVPVVLGSDDGIVVWLNGKKLLARNVTRDGGADRNVRDVA